MIGSAITVKAGRLTTFFKYNCLLPCWKRFFGKDRHALTIMFPLICSNLYKGIVSYNEPLVTIILKIPLIANLRPYTYWPLVILACAITQHLATTFIFLSVFVRLKEQILDSRTLVSVSIACFFIGYSIWNAHGRRQRLDRHATRV